MNDRADNPFPAILEGQSAPTMSSREIADLCEARHNDVVATIERLFENGVLRESRKTLRGFSPEGGGRPTQVDDLTKRDCLVVVSGYNDAVRAKIIDRWMELEADRADPMKALADPAWLRSTLLVYTEQNIALKAENAALLPKAEVHDRIVDAEGSLCVTDAAKTLQITRNVLFRWLRSNGWIYRRAGTNHDVAYQSRLASGVLIHKLEAYERSDGSDGTRTQVRVTPKGLTVLAQAFPRAAKAA